MSVIRASYMTAFIMCLPLLIWLWGSIANADTVVDASVLIRQALSFLFCLQLTVILISAPFFQQSGSIYKYFQANLLLILIPLPFVSIAWLAAAISISAIIKIICIELLIVLIVLFISMLLKHLRSLVKFDILLGIIASIYIWSTRVQWQAWLN